MSTLAARSDAAFREASFPHVGPEAVHAAFLFDVVDASLLPPPSEAYVLDLSDASVRRLMLGMSLASAVAAVAGLGLAFLAG